MEFTCQFLDMLTKCSLFGKQIFKDNILNSYVVNV